MLKHNHGPNWGILVDGCPRCEELLTKPYIVVYKLGSDHRIQRVPVATVNEAIAHIKARLPDTLERIPIVQTPGGKTIAILRAE